MSENIKIYVLSADKSEAMPTLEILKKHQIHHHYIEIGIGINCLKKIYGCSLSQTLEQAKKHKYIVIYIGSCGMFVADNDRCQYSLNNPLLDHQLPILVGVDQIELSLPSTRKNQAETIFDHTNYIVSNLHPMLADNIYHAKCFCSLAITTDQSLAPLGLEQSSRAWVENLEIYFAKQWFEFAYYVIILLPITNYINFNARLDWNKNTKKAACMCGDFISDNIVDLII